MHQWVTTPESNETAEADRTRHSGARGRGRSFHRLSDTLRLYAGWWLAWYLLMYAIGTYQRLHPLPVRIEFFEKIAGSGLLLNLALATFLFLLLSSVHRRLQGEILSGVALTVIGMGLFLLFVANI